MHRKQGSDLIPADTELERTLRSLRKTKRVEKAAIEKELSYYILLSLLSDLSPLQHFFV